jgi:GNAT superfamily N-acetyltransferase
MRADDMSGSVPLFSDAWTLMVGRLPLPHIEDADGVVSCFGNVPLFFLNLSIVGRPAANHDELRAFLRTSARRAAACPYPSGLVLRQDWLPAGWEALVEEASLAPMVPMTSMETDELHPARYRPPTLDIRRVADDAMARDLAQLNAAAYHMPAEAFDCIANMRLWHADSYACVGYVGGTPVSCAAAFPVRGTVYIALVATAPAEQGKGYGEAVTRHAVIQGRYAMRTTRTALHASDMGLPVYRRMGYQPGPRMVILGPAR